MPDRVDELLDALERTPVPLTWAEVEARRTTALVEGKGRRGGHRWILGVAASVLLVAVAAVAFVVTQDDELEPAETGPAPTSTDASTTTDAPTTTAPSTTVVASDNDGPRTFAVTAWTGNFAGSRYVVWGGEEGSDALLTNDGWSFDPDTGKVEPIPPAPIAPRSGATGVWTVSGSELVVCCGIAAEGDRTDTAAAYALASGSWRTLADPPAELTGRYAASVWNVRCPHPEAECDPDRPPVDFVVVSGSWSGPTEVANYDPRSDQWRTIEGAPDDIGTQPEVAWTGRELIVWSRTGDAGGADVGHRYDPETDAWALLPGLPPEDEITWGSVTWTGEEVVVWGLSAHQDTTDGIGRGFRWRPGDDTWTPLPDPGLPPIDYYNGTPGSQAILWDPVTDRVILYPTHGYEYGSDPETGAPGPVPLLAYDPATDSWERLGEAMLGYAPQLTAGGGYLFRPDPADPIVLDLTP